MTTDRFRVLSTLPPHLQTEVNALISAHPASEEVICKLIQHFAGTGPPDTASSSDAQPNKKRKLQSSSTTPPPSTSADHDDILIASLPDVSFSLPSRRKYTVNLNRSSIQLINPKTQTTDASFAVSSIRHAFSVPTPNKAKDHYTFCLLVENGDAVVFGLDDVVGKDTYLGVEKGGRVRDVVVSHLEKVLNVKVMKPDANLFRSMLKKGQLYLEGYSGVRDAVIYPLPTGLLIGMKKPWYWFPLEKINNINIVKPTGRTFSLMIEAAAGVSYPPQGEGEKEHDLQMIDVAEMGPIGHWVGTCHSRFGKRAPIATSSAPVEGGDVESMAVDDDDASEDEDFAPDDEDSCPEEHDSDYDSDGHGSVNGDAAGSQGEQSDEEASEEGEEDAPRIKGHPLPRMSQTAMNAVLGAVQEAFGMEDEDDDEGGASVGDEEESTPDVDLEDAPAPSPAASRIGGGMAAIAAQIEKERQERLNAAKQVKKG
ncbi:hypothetical protein HDU85_005207 [Gaertneriomyces sp. JEL0708]|nr:hypothetical protein HDU85_005207 [Gaertneriomyces sp. JEL0708]